MNLSAEKLKTFFPNFLLLAVFCFTLNSFLSYEEYTLMQDGKWSSTRAELKKGCGSSWAYMFTKTALAKNQLNLSVWNGYQELIYKKPVEFGSAGFRYKADGDFFSFVIAKTDSLQYGIRFRGNGTEQSFAYIADKEYRFLEKYPFQLSDRQDEWNDVTIVRKQDSFTLQINSTTALKFNMIVPQSVHFGFKGGGNTSTVDDVIIKNKQGAVMVAENFSPPFKVYILALLLTLTGVLLLAGFLLQKKWVPSFLYFNGCITLGLLFAYGFYYFWLSERYPLIANCADWFGMTRNIEGETEVCDTISSWYPLEKVAGKKRVILFLGSSQTWGSGATAENKTMPRLVEKKIQTFLNDTNIVIINCGIAGFTANRVYEFYPTQWCKYKPELTIINLSTNDQGDTTRFRKSIEEFLVYNRNNHIKTLLIQEPNYFSCSFLQINHATLDSLGQKYQVPVLAMQAYMDSLQDTGFLWWDYVHCTNYGYSLMSERVAPAIIQSLQQNSHE